MPKPKLIIIAGANGCGKTSIKKNLMSNPWTAGCEYINPDDIARDQFGGWDKKEHFEKAQHYATDLTYKNLSQGKDMVLETAFSSERKLQLIVDAKKAGFFIRLYFISTDSPVINAARVCRRMLNDGHEVLLRDIIKRHKGAFDMCIEASPLVDRLYVFDNSIEDHPPKELFRVRDGYLHKLYDELLDHTWSKDLLGRVHSRLKEAQQAAIEERVVVTDKIEATIAHIASISETTSAQDRFSADVIKAKPK